MSRRTKILLAATLQAGLVVSIGSHVGWHYMNYVLYLTAGLFLSTLISFIADAVKNEI